MATWAPEFEGADLRGVDLKYSNLARADSARRSYRRDSEPFMFGTGATDPSAAKGPAQAQSTLPAAMRRRSFPRA
jgi:hypothetical protein